MATNTEQKGHAPADEAADAATRPSRRTIANAALMIYIERGQPVGPAEEVSQRSAS